MTRILLARHGETDWNRLGRWQGHADPPLNEAGLSQAAELAERLAGDGIAAVYSSDLVRASETARVVADRLGLDVVEDARLREIDVGSWSGLTRAEVEQRFPEGYARWLDGEIGHDGETREELTERVVGAVDHRRCALGRRHVGDGPVGPPGATDRRDRLVERLLASGAEHDVDAFLDEARRDASADTPARARDECDLAREPEIHAASLVA